MHPCSPAVAMIVLYPAIAISRSRSPSRPGTATSWPLVIAATKSFSRVRIGVRSFFWEGCGCYRLMFLEARVMIEGGRDDR
jgi:hypothetical protein